MVHDLEHAPFLRELDLGLCRVDIHIDPGAAELKVHDAGGIAPGQKAVFIRLLDRGLKKRRADIPAVAVKILRAAVAAAGGGRRDEAVDAQLPVLAGAGQHVLCDISPEQGVHRGLGAPVARGEELLLPVADETDGYLGSPEGAAQRRLHTGGGLAAVGFQKLEPRGGVIEQPLDGHDGALRAAGGPHVLNVPGGQGDKGAFIVAAAAGGELHLGHGGYRRKSFAAEAHRTDGFKPVLVMELRRGVAQEGDARVLGRHAAAIVRDADERRAAALYFDGDGLCTGVKGVFHQLLDDGGGTLDDLARGDHIGNVWGEYIYNGHEHLTS